MVRRTPWEERRPAPITIDPQILELLEEMTVPQVGVIGPTLKITPLNEEGTRVLVYDVDMDPSDQISVLFFRDGEEHPTITYPTNADLEFAAAHADSTVTR